MKKNIFILIAVVLGMTACNEVEMSATRPLINGYVQAAPPNGGGQDDDLKNFCKGCGISNVAADGCHSDECREDQICEMREAEIIANSANVNFDLSFNKAYEIRDGFLINTSKGQDYISHFYEFGGFLIDRQLINKTNIFDFVNFGHQVFDAVNNLRIGNDSMIILDSDLRKICLDYVKLIRANNPPIYISKRLDMVESELAFFVNRPKSFVMANI